MNRLAPEHIHLILDEPIYVLNDHFDHQAEVKTDSLPTSETNPISFRGANKKGILIIADSENSLVADNETFLLKGLNALNLTLDDVALVSAGSDENLSVPHKKKISFTAEDNAELAYSTEVFDSISVLACHSLDKIRNDDQLKRKFWEGLKGLLKE